MLRFSRANLEVPEAVRIWPAGCLYVVLWCSGFGSAFASEAYEPITRRLPPPGLQLPEEQVQALQERLHTLSEQLRQVRHRAHRADVSVLLKAVSLALKHGEFYRTEDGAKAEALLQLATDRLTYLQASANATPTLRENSNPADNHPTAPPWALEKGLVVRGYVSPIDDSAQPYGLVIPESLDLSGPARVPLFVWLHGRGDKTTDLHFLHQRLHQTGQIAPENAIVVHPFGRHCIGFKSAGERDVLHVVDHVLQQYPVDPDRVVLMGFSMGGAGAWHLGAHFADRWAALSPGAGFAETAQYNRLSSEQYPDRYEQALWGVYDVPGYVRNLFNIPVIAYSGENDKQIQAARVMEDAYQQQGRQLPHLIGPGMGHKYHPDTLQELLGKMVQAAHQGRPKSPHTVHLQTRTLRYARQYWVEVQGLGQHWKDSRVDARLADDQLKVQTRNVTHLQLAPPADIQTISIDGQTLAVVASAHQPVRLIKDEQDHWSRTARTDHRELRKRPGLQGPIDDAFLEPFLVVVPTGEPLEPRYPRWVKFELQHFVERWQALFRGHVRIKDDVEVTAEDIKRFHLIVWGDPRSNRILAKALAHQGEGALPLKWSAKRVVLGGHSFDASHHLPALIHPNPLNPERYLVINSGPTFREAHDRTNSLQNPKLPDWAVIDLALPPSDEAPGGLSAMGFFDERWQVPVRARKAQP